MKWLIAVCVLFVVVDSTFGVICLRKATQPPPIETEAPTEAPTEEPTEAPIEKTTLEPECTYAVPVSNVAEGKTAIQSSTKGKGDFAPENAVDGNTGSDACAQTKRQNKPNWILDLGEQQDVYEVLIYHEGGDLGRLIKGAMVRVGDDTNHRKNPQCGIKVDKDMKKENPVRVRCNDDCGPLTGRYVSVEMTGDKEKSLTLCEVEVMTG